MQAARGASLSSSVADSESEPTRWWKAPISRRREWSIFLPIVAVLITLDQWLKAWAVSELDDGRTIEIFGDYFGLHLVRNPGAAFSMGTSFTEVLTVISAVATVVVAYLMVRVRSTMWAFGLGVLFAGVVGNLLDRLTREPGFGRGHVIDMFALPDFPVFNVADVCINVAAAVILIQAVRGVQLNGTRENNDE